MFKMNSWKTPRFFDLPIFQVEGTVQDGAEMSLQETFEDAKKLVDRGLSGDAEAAKKAVEVLEDLRKRIELNHLVEAYYGSAVALLGQGGENSSERVGEGLRILEDAVSNEPDNSEMMTLRDSINRLIHGAVAETTVEEDIDLAIQEDGTESDLAADSDGYEQVEMDNRQAFAEWFNWGGYNLTEFEDSQDLDQYPLDKEDPQDEMAPATLDNGEIGEVPEEREEEVAPSFTDEPWEVRSEDYGYKPWKLDTQAEWEMPADDTVKHRSDDWAQVEQDEIEDEREDEQEDVQEEEIQPAEPENSTRETYMEGFRLYDLALAGDREATRSALELWEGIYQNNPEDTMAQAYFGGCLILEARNDDLSEMAFRHTAEGLKLVNRAVERDPGNLRLRYLRAYLTYRAPDDTFRMNEVAIEDFTVLKQSYEEDNQSFNTELYHQILYDLGFAYENRNRQRIFSQSFFKNARIPNI
ncbi:MAG: hypothetical protein ACOY35_11585 [Bacillota bacterium]